MDPRAKASLNAERRLSDKEFESLCYAPHTSLYFDVRGDVRVCCHNHTFPVGNIRRQSLDEIWRGAAIRQLRAALEAFDFGPGCEFCQRQTEGAQFSGAGLLRFDRFGVSREHPWPLQMEFSISNSCNLECIMCRGQWSSAIRARREHLPPLPRVYSDGFFQDIVKYLPRVRRLKFLGGEPFLIVEYFRIWDLLALLGLATPCHVTTNGTQLNPRIEKVLEKLPFSFAVSIDGYRKETIEGIRVNAVYEELMANARWFREYARARKTDFSFTFCLMRQNWKEFAELCEMADSWDCSVGVNTVVQPPQFGIYTLPPDDLAQVLDAMERQAATVGTRLRRNRAVWFGELERIRYRVRGAKSDREDHPLSGAIDKRARTNPAAR